MVMAEPGAIQCLGFVLFRLFELIAVKSKLFV